MAPFADAGDYVVFLVPWSPGDRREQTAAITGFDGFEITRVVGDAATTEVALRVPAGVSEAVAALARWRGATAGVEAAEAFDVVRELR